MSFLAAQRERWTRLAPAGRALIRTPNEEVAPSELGRRIDRARSWLHARGLRSGDVVALQTHRELAFLEVHLAALAEGIGTLPLHPSYTAAELTHILDDAQPRLSVLQDPAATPGPDRMAADDLRAALDTHSASRTASRTPPTDASLALLCYTSGTTGRPKGARITHANLRACVSALHDAWGFRPDDGLLHALPLFHIHGLVVAQHVALWAGAHTEWLPRFDADAVLDRLGSGHLTVFMGVPTFHHRLLDRPGTFDLSAVRLITSGSAPLPAATWAAFHDRFGHEILERYGMTEVGIVLSNPLAGPRIPGSVGVPLPGVRMRIVDEHDDDVQPGVVGQLLIAGPSVFEGYHGRPEATAAAITSGWMHTGDLARLGDEGHVYLQGRRDDLILSGGYNVYPPEVVSTLLEHPAVTEAAVVGQPDDDLGARVVAAVVLSQPVDDEALHAHMRARLAPYKCPRAWLRLPALPRNSMGKVLATRLREALTRAPHAEEIGTLRRQVDRARRGAVDLARIRHLPADARRGHGEGATADVVAEVLGRWFPEHPEATLADVRQQLEPLAGRISSLASALEAARHAQHEALHQPIHAVLVATVGELSTEHAAAEERARHARARSLHLAALRDAVTASAASLAEAPERVAADVASALRDGLLRVAEATGLPDPLPHTADPTTWMETAAEALTEALADAEPQTRQAERRRDRLGARLTDILG